MPSIANRQRFFRRLGTRVRELRTNRGYSQEDMMSLGFSARHWQQIEAGRPITVSTLLRICAAFEVPLERLVRGLDRGIYEGGRTWSRETGRRPQHLSGSTRVPDWKEFQSND